MINILGAEALEDLAIKFAGSEFPSRGGAAKIQRIFDGVVKQQKYSQQEI
ncbi:hypothetical protein [Chryseobacterium luteum]|nr:hypothetical protein [Chryseobacterium luteum]